MSRQDEIRAYYLQRDLEIYTARMWGESKVVLAARYQISPGRIGAVVADMKHRGRMIYPRCTACGHSGSMHHDAEWNYNRGPCAEYLCECPAMVPGHD